MNELYILYTHTLFWHLINSPRLSATAQQIFQKGYAGTATLVLSSIVLLELYGLAKKVNAPFDFNAELAVFAQPPFQIEATGLADLHLFDRLSGVTELHDRLIAVLAFRLGAPLVTRDQNLTACPDITCIW